MPYLISENLENIVFCTATSINANQSWSRMTSMLGQLFFIVLVLGFVLFLVVICTKIMGVSRFVRNKNMKSVESLSTGLQTSLQLIKVGNKFFLVGVTKENINLISEINGDDLDLSEDKPQGEKFSKYLNDFMNKNKKKNDDE